MTKFELLQFLFTKAIDNKDLNEIKTLLKKNSNYTCEDIVFEIYKRDLLTPERLQFLVKNNCNYLKIPSFLLKMLLKTNKLILLDIIFSNLKLFDNEFILKLLFYHKNNISVSQSELEQQIENYKLSTLEECILNYEFEDIDSDCFY